MGLAELLKEIEDMKIDTIDTIFKELSEEELYMYFFCVMVA